MILNKFTANNNDGIKNLIDFKIVDCGKEQCLPNKIVPGKAKPFYTLHYVFGGVGYIKYGNKSFSLSSGDMFLIYPEMEVEYKADEKNPWQYSWMVFTGAVVDRLIYKTSFTKENIKLSIGRNEEFEGIVNNLINSYIREGDINFETIGYGFIILNKLKTISGYDSLNVKTSNEEMHLREAIDFVYYNLTTEITIESISKALNLSSSYLSRIFNKHMGLSTKQFILDTKLSRAKYQLENTDIKVKEVAKMVGFEDQYHFSHLFKKKYGIAPNNVKKVI